MGVSPMTMLMGMIMFSLKNHMVKLHFKKNVLACGKDTRVCLLMC